MDKNLSESFKILISKQMTTSKTWTRTLDPDLGPWTRTLDPAPCTLDSDPGPWTLDPGPGPWTLDPDTGPNPEKPGP